MNLTISGHHLELTPAIREYITSKIARTKKHFDHVIDVNVLLSVEKLRQKAEATVNLRGKALHVEATEADLYAAIDAMADKLERQVLKHKEHLKSHHNESPKRKDIPDPTGDTADE
jgi:putative sigma-54 modulation protein